MKNVLLIIGGVIVVAVCGYLLYLKAMYIDESVTSGEAYGFSIGDSKSLSYSKAKTVFADQNIFIADPIDDENIGPHKKFAFKPEEYNTLENRNNWKIYYSKEDYWDTLELNFNNNNLSSIYRHRQKFELP